MPLPLDELEILDQPFGAGRQRTQLIRNMLLFGHGGLLEAAFELLDFLTPVTTSFDFFLPFATSHVETLPGGRSWSEPESFLYQY